MKFAKKFNSHIVQHTYDYTEFTLLDDSLVRVNVQPHHRIAVQIILSKGKKGNVIEKISSGQNGAEVLLAELTPGDYVLEFHYSATTAKELPLPYECVAVGVEIAVEPVSMVKQDETAISNCESSEFPTLLLKDAHFYRAYQPRSISSPLDHKVTFTAETESLFLFRAKYELSQIISNKKVTTF